jgi:RNA polymerase sigma-70 factor (ECF subfamily)
MDTRVDQQDTEAWARAALAQMLPELRASARLLANSRAEADDMVQEALVRMLNGLDRFVPLPDLPREASLRGWALAVLRNAFREGWRRARRERNHAGEMADAEEGRTGGQEAKQDLHDLARHIARLPPALREAVVLVGARGLSHEEAAAICNVPVGTMKARLSRARRSLAMALDPVTR